jgi:glycosyltransferase involved in cell wall biosynthesis
VETKASPTGPQLGPDARPGEGAPLLIGICVVRNEADVVGEVLRSAAAQHDLILVVDTASSDGTVDEVRAVAKDEEHVVLMASLPAPTWAERVRRHVWARISPCLPERTWWSFVDGDEFCRESLSSVVSEAEAEGADHVQGAFATFAYTRGEAEAWRQGRETLADRTRSIEERRLFYVVSAYSERLFRGHSRLRWNEDTYVPGGLIRPLRRRICYRHYPNRDLPQLELRLSTRSGLDLTEEHRSVHYHWHHSVEEALNPDDDPKLQRHEPGSLIALPEPWRRVWVKDPFRRTAARARRLVRARVPQEAGLFADLPVDAIIERIKRT